MAASALDRFRLGLSRWLLSPLQGTTLPVWRQALSDNGWAVPPRFWPRALLTTLSAAVNSRQARRERQRFEREWATVEVRAPLFVLGHYRSGTTHLHNLLAADGRFAFPDNFQANFPWTFLSTEARGKQLGSYFTMRKRPHDNVALDLDVPTEDELALCSSTLLSPHMDWHFPRAGGRYTRRYLDFAEASEAERDLWVRGLRTFARKLTLRHDKPLVLKSPLHTARLPLLLRAFPDARFVLVHRHPFEVFRSTRRMEAAVEPLFRYQHSSFERRDERILERYRRMYDRYLADRASVPQGQLVEIGYEELETAPLAALERIYRTLELPEFAIGRPAIEAYLRSISGYRKNRYAPLESDLRDTLAREWHATFEAWGYSPHLEP